jgi:mitochondrial fission protein ELM1
LVIAPRHDALPPGRNIVEVSGAVSRSASNGLAQARTQLTAHPQYRQEVAAARHDGPVVSVLLGGHTDDYALTASFAQRVLLQVAAACEELGGTFLVTTSRRTSPEAEQMVAARAGTHPRCRMLLLASRDSLEGTMEGLLGVADVVVVTGESVSMVSEACASGRYVIAVEPSLKRPESRPPEKMRRFLRQLAADGYLRVNQVPEIAMAIRRILAEKRPIKRLDDYTRVQDAVSKLL